MTTPDVRRAGNGNGNGKITREAVLAAALEIIDRDGADALSMRRLARALGRDPMIIYRHAPGKAALLDGVAEAVLGQLQVDCADPDWAGQLREVARRYRALALAHPYSALALAHPHVVPLIVTRPVATPLGLRPAGTLRPGRHPGPAHPGRVQRTRRPAHLPGPLLRGLAPVLGGYDGAAELERGLDILLTGLTST